MHRARLLSSCFCRSGHAAIDQLSTSRPSTGPVYDQAHLAELRASTLTSRPRISADGAYDGDISLNVDDVFQEIADVPMPSMCSGRYQNFTF
jgi:hypothetical protein